MAGINDLRPSIKYADYRNAEQIRQDITQAEQEMAQTVEKIGDRLKEKLDWQEYVKETPYLALGIAAGLGYLAAGMFAKKRTPMDQLLDAVADEIRGAAGGMASRTAGPEIIKSTLLGIASKAAVNWMQNVAEKHKTTRQTSNQECCTAAKKESQGDTVT